MARNQKRQSDIDEEKFKRLVAEGRGQGTGSEYVPFQRVDEGTSKGRGHTTSCSLTGFRTHELRSDIEYFAFLELWVDESVEDIRERYPLLPIARTLRIANLLGVRHPHNSQVKFWIPQTVDFLVTTSYGLKAVSVMEDVAWDNPRTKKVHEIALTFLAEEGIPLHLRLASDLRTQRSENIRWIYDGRRAMVDPCVLESKDPLVSFVLRSVENNPGIDSRELVRTLDTAYQLLPGTTLSLIRRLLSERIIKTNLNARDISRGCPLKIGVDWYGRF